MKVLKTILAGLCMLVSVGLYAQSGPEGTWEGTLVTAPGAEMAVRFIITATDGGDYSVVITSPTNGALKDVPATAVSIDGNDLHFEFASLSGEYDGSLAGGAIEGQWKQVNQTFPLNLAAYEKPQMTAEDVNFLTGTWNATLKVPGVEVPVVFHFEKNDEGGLSGKFDSPKEGAFGLPINNIEYDGAKLKFTLDFAGVAITGDLADGGFDSNWNQRGQDLPLRIERGESDFKPPEAVLTLDETAQETLMGTWSGKLGPVTLVFRFEKDDEGAFRGYVDSPVQKVTGLVITEASLEGTTLTFSLQAPPARYSGEIMGDEIKGTWYQGPGANPLTVTRGEPEEESGTQ